jgi:hypothetical protein
MSQEQNKKTLRHFQCRDYLWEIFEQMSGELECSTDYLINEAMRQYARSRNYGSRTPAAAGSSRPSEPSAAPVAAAPAPMTAQTAPIPRMDAPPAIPAMPRPSAPAAAPRPSIPSAPPPPPARPAAPPAYPGAYTAPPVPSYPAAPGYPSAPPALPAAPRPSYPSQGGYGAPPSAPAYGAPATPSYAPETQRPPSFGGAPPPLPGAPRVPSSPGVAPAPAGGGAMPTLFAIFNGQKVPVAKEEFVIGRGSKSADLAIKDGNISRRHAAVVFQAGAFYMKDLGSTNGVEHQGRRIDSKRIEEGDLFQICDYEIRFTYR